FRVGTTWLQGVLAVRVGAAIKRRLLAGALRLLPEEVRLDGIGTFLTQALEAEAMESFAISAGVASALAIIELIVTGIVLRQLPVLLLITLAVTFIAGWMFRNRLDLWIRMRMGMTRDLVENMVGHRTRVAQQPSAQWHEAEDQVLSEYWHCSYAVDRIGAVLVAGIPRMWVLLGLAVIAPSIAARTESGTQLATLFGGILLGFTALKRLTYAFSEVAAAVSSCWRLRPLFQAASRPESLGQLLDDNVDCPRPAKVLEADRLSFRYRKEGNPVIQSCNLTIFRGDKILLEGPSGGGKTTLASLMTGMRHPDSGLLLANGLDRHTLGEHRWRRSIATAPQFHENHILTETLAFNLLMGRNWPPTAQDMIDAEQICRELGLGPLLDTMPSGLLQMVGEGGWQLSHGERSRVFIARALLQKSDLIILDESFGALDPENMRTALECTMAHSESLLVIAHP
ncbi:MAG: ATP-binding cassette domain-containing protein, partial [Acidobacteria bacterium]|nr:ATP-binding cassette domain-containing protein [Acidobacteriota bacterium]